MSSNPFTISFEALAAIAETATDRARAEAEAAGVPIAAVTHAKLAKSGIGLRGQVKRKPKATRTVKPRKQAIRG